MLNRGFQCCKRNKYYDAKIRNVDSGYVVFDAIETSIEYSEEEFYPPIRSFDVPLAERGT